MIYRVGVGVQFFYPPAVYLSGNGDLTSARAAKGNHFM